MGIRSLGTESSTYNDVFGETGETGLREGNVGPWIAASGGTTTTYTAPHPVFGTAEYKSHTFTSSGSFQITAITDKNTVNKFDFWVQAGGGGTKSNPMGPPGPGGGNRECGSGAGGATNGSGVTAATGTFPVTIGGGGSGANGSDSTLALPAPQVAVGGGAGGAGDTGNNSGNPGGCGGGGWYTSGQPNKGLGTQANTPLGTGYGNPGGDGDGSPDYGGAGGGTGGAGVRGTSNGPGTLILYRYGAATPQTYGAGGVASDYPSTNRQAAGAANSGDGSSAIAAGGSGIVVIRYVSGA